MNDLLLSLPPFLEVEFIKKETKEVIKSKSGLCIKYLTHENKWVCKYGTPGSNQKLKDMDYYGIGDTPEESVNDFIRVMRDASKKKDETA